MSNVLELALEALTEIAEMDTDICGDVATKAIAALKEAIKQQGEHQAEIVADENGYLSTQWAVDYVPNAGDKLYTSAPTIPVGHQLIRSEVVAFLDGSGKIDGCAFGDVDTSKPRPRYWWRAFLKDTPKPKEKP